MPIKESQALSPLETRVLLLAPTESDAEISERILRQAGMTLTIVRAMSALCDELARGAGAVLMTEEAIHDERIEDLRTVIARQPVWSDIPIVLLVSGGASSDAAAFALERLGNILLLECPVRVNSLVSTVRVALRDRKRQYDTRGYQQELVEQAETLWRSNKELEQFAYVSSHDLKEPLRKIVNYAQLLESRYAGELKGDGEKYLHNITDGAERMRNLIEGLLAFSRLTKTEQKMENVDLSQTLAEVVNDLEMSIADRRAKIVSGVLPTVRANALQMQQLFQNLIANALKFSRQAPEIVMNAQEREYEWRVSVSDNGIGIEAPYRERIFNVFSRLHSRSEYPGTGIGLAICKKIVESHGGRIWVEPSAKGGSVFIFTLAKNPVLAAEPLEPQSSATPPAVIPAKAGIQSSNHLQNQV